LGLPLVDSATVNYTQKTLTITGQNFGSSPTVTLDTLTLPTVSSASGQIVADFPNSQAPSSFTPGTYFLTVAFKNQLPVIFTVDIGANGPQGPTGPQGPVGPQGATGATGTSGPAGPAGPQGVAGPVGPAGATGATGAQGPQGLTGATGATGAAGAAGAAGSAGTNGTNGFGFTYENTWSSATAYTTNDVVTENGTSYVALRNNSAVNPAIDVSNSGGNWAIFAAGGAQGSAGPAGPAGPDGLAGSAAILAIGSVTTSAPGSPALVTNVGTTSSAILDFTIPQGPTGPVGPAGAGGAIGPTGPAGPAGATGAQGPQGSTGAQGPQGATGPQGPSGTNGCGTAVSGNPAYSAQAVGLLNPGSSADITSGPLSSASAASAETWYTVTVETPQIQTTPEGTVVYPLAAHPHMTMTSDSVTYAFDVLSNYGGAWGYYTNCLNGGTSPAVGLVSQFDGGFATSQSTVICTQPNQFQLLYVRVRAVTPNPNCTTFTLLLTD